MAHKKFLNIIQAFSRLAIRLPEINRLVVCSALHYADYGGFCDYSIISEILSRQLLSNILFEGESRSLKIDIKSSQDVDSDFYFLCTANHLVLSISDYSAVAAECLGQRGANAKVYIDILRQRHRDISISYESVREKGTIILDKDRI